MVKVTRIATTVCALGALLATTGLAQTAFAQTQAETTSVAPLATGLTDGGAAEAQVVEAVRAGDVLTIKLRFKPLATNQLERIYDSISQDAYENSFYVLAGNKKYLLLTDSSDKPLTNPNLVIKANKDSLIAGSWHGRFPAPPKDVTEVSLTIPGVETLDAIKLTDR
ncbi:MULTISPECIES: hypothetical protein [Ensifer]|uniref:hypothetical protein n=1 Tax=Ensifer TaxID=106591 RepID=UPI000A9F505D|nr:MULTISPECIES: hypothetical protein [Ensifer]